MKISCYSVDVLRPFLEALFGSTGVSSDDAALVSDTFIEANLRGVDSHGIRLVPAYIRRLAGGGVNPSPQFKIISDKGASVRIDGDNSLGQVAGAYAMKLAMKRAETYGIGFALVGQTSHIGAASYYTRMAVSHQMAGLATSNNLPSLYVWGGLKRAISNPPVSISFPTKTTPFNLDICLGTVAWNKIYMRLNENKPIPQGWAWDTKGKTTTDPSAASDGGSIIPVGGHKGSGLTIGIDLLTGVLSGFQFGAQVGGLYTSDKAPEACACVMIALDVAQLLGPEFLDRAEELIRWCKDSPLAEGFDEILMPGEPEEKIRKQRLIEGIPLTQIDIDQLRDIAEQKDIKSPFL